MGSSKEYILTDITTDTKKTFKSLKEMSEYTGRPTGNLGSAIRNGSTVAKRWRIKKVAQPIEIEMYKPRVEGFDYRKLRKQMLSYLERTHTQGIVFIDESSRHNTGYYDIHLKDPSDEVLETIKGMIV